MQLNWSDWFTNHASNDAGNRNMQVYSDILSSTDLDFEKLRSLVKYIDTAILAADETRNIIIFHSPKNFGGMWICPENKVVGMIGIGAQATWVKINLISALANCNIIVRTVNELAACTTAQEVATIPVPKVIGVVGFEGSAIFILAPVLRNAILVSNTQNPFETIPVILATATAFDAAHANNGNMTGTAITHSDDINAWLYVLKQGLINKRRYSVIPEDEKVTQFHTNRQLQCILNGAQGLAIGGGMAAKNDAVLIQLTAAIFAQNKAATESNDLQRNEIYHQLTKDKSKKDQTKKIHPSMLKMIVSAAAATSNDKNKDLPATFTCFVNCKSVRVAQYDLVHQFKKQGFPYVAFALGTTQALFMGEFLYSDSSTPSNFTGFCFP